MKKILLIITIIMFAHLCFAYPMPHPFLPFHIAGNLYYVGTDDLASYLVVTSKGNIDLKKKYNLLHTTSKNPFVDSQGYKAHITQKEQEFYTELQKQKSELH